MLLPPQESSCWTITGESKKEQGNEKFCFYHLSSPILGAVGYKAFGQKDGTEVLETTLYDLRMVLFGVIGTGGRDGRAAKAMVAVSEPTQIAQQSLNALFVVVVPVL
uniref:Uncharacterized protein n=1 Tax=Grammatophora oceanica TaxID=210454 RepID=A0A7S1VJ70_9STRA|mmetsp:Transcript_46719/g.69480  ORF Transcript_46719/g.69480 Transcript_46719/m.69480 type:complete len:107 (+) Transcript_46719:115-435(+)